MKKELTVIFRKYSNGDVIALFPYELENAYGDVLSYMHIGQHSIATYNFVIRNTKLATEEEYSDLLNELKGIYDGHKIKVLKRMNGRKYRNELGRILF
jgi:hypothetical protein